MTHPSPPPRRRGAPVLVVGALVGAVAACADAPADAPPGIRTDTTATGIAWTATGRGPAVVLIHGTNLDRRTWSRVVDDLAVDHTVVAYDLRSHGASIDADGPWSDLDDLTAVLDAAGLDRATLVGHSAGAGIALEYGLEHLERTAGLVLVSPSVRGFRPAPGEVPDVFGPLVEALPTGDVQAIGDALTALPTFRVGPADQAAVDAVVRDNLRLFRVDPAWARTPGTPPLERLGELAAPLAVVVGDDDFAATRRLARELADARPGASLAVLAGAPHLVPWTHPEAVAAAVRRLPPP